jgi:hypothetical protein
MTLPAKELLAKSGCGCQTQHLAGSDDVAPVDKFPLMFAVAGFEDQATDQ